MKVKLVAFTDTVGESVLTIGNTYEVLEEYEGVVGIRDDNGEHSELYEGEYEEVV